MHVLDNPIYNSLLSAHRSFNLGSGDVQYYQPDVSPFAGMKENSEAEFQTLLDNSPGIDSFVFFTLVPVHIPEQWNAVRRVDMFQMVYEGNRSPSAGDQGIVDLSPQHVPEMMELVKLTQPGPFREQTIALGNYAGIFEGGKLVAMAGHRFNPEPYVEISAVCTHPAHLGKGLGFRLMNEQVKRIKESQKIPFLHVRNDNHGAIALYKKAGFTIRTEMIAYLSRSDKDGLGHIQNPDGHYRQRNGQAADNNSFFYLV